MKDVYQQTATLHKKHPVDIGFQTIDYKISTRGVGVLRFRTSLAQPNLIFRSSRFLRLENLDQQRTLKG